MKAYLASFPPTNLVLPVEFARISQYHADCSMTMALAQLGNGVSSRPLLTKNDLGTGFAFATPSGISILLNAQTPDGFTATITPSGGSGSTQANYTSDILVNLLNGLSATKK
jgi:hypothetical protein